MLDYFHVMTYDFHGSWEQNVGENSPLYKGPADQGSMIYFNVVSVKFISFCWFESKRFVELNRLASLKS